MEILTLSRSTRQVTTFDKITYGSGEFFNGTTTVIILMLYLKFLIDSVGLSPFLAGVCVMAGKLWDAFSDPLIGMISDRTSSRFGRRRLFFLLFCIPASVSFVSMWTFISTDHVWAKVIYYSLTYITFKTLSTALNVPYQALGPEMTTDYNERTSLVTFRMAFSLLGSIVAGVVPNLVVKHYANMGRPQTGHLVVASAFGLVYVFIWLWIFFRIKETPNVPTPKYGSFLATLKPTLKNRSFRILIGLYLCAFLALDTVTASAKFYVEDYIGNPSLMPVVMGTMLTCALLSLPLHFLIVKKYTRRTACVSGLLLWMSSLLVMSFVPPGAPDALVVGIMIFIGIGIASAFVVPWSALPEVIDVDQVVNGRKQEGVFTGVMTFLRKLSTTGAILILSTTLENAGYKSGQSQGDEVLLAIRIMTTVVPVGILLAGVFIAWKYPITKRFHALLRAKLDHKSLTTEDENELKKLLQKAY